MLCNKLNSDENGVGAIRIYDTDEEHLILKFHSQKICSHFFSIISEIKYPVYDVKGCSRCFLRIRVVPKCQKSRLAN